MCYAFIGTLLFSFVYLNAVPLNSKGTALFLDKIYCVQYNMTKGMRLGGVINVAGI